jgi:uracil-DNA glycosylase family 4
LAIVGLAPAAHGANRTGRVFTGDRSADWLIAALWRAGYANQPTSTAVTDGLALSGAWMTAAVRCAPPANKPTPDERDRCLPFLVRELALLENLAVIVALGGFAYQVVAGLFGLKPRPKFGHLVEARLPDGRMLVCSYHPSQQNTFTGVLTQPMLDAVFARARQLGA